MMKKNILCLIYIVAFIFVGCDCVKIRRLKGENYSLYQSVHKEYRDVESFSPSPSHSESTTTIKEFVDAKENRTIINDLDNSNSKSDQSLDTDFTNLSTTKDFTDLPEGQMAGGLHGDDESKYGKAWDTFRKDSSNKDSVSPNEKTHDSQDNPQNKDSKATRSTRINWVIYTEYPAQEEISVPQSVMIDGVETEKDSLIKSGEHQIIVTHPGHEILRATINIAENLKVYIFKGTLKTLPRKVEAQVQYDIQPPISLGDTQIVLTSQQTGNKVYVNDSTAVKPGDYKLDISKEGYIALSKNVRIYPLLSPFKIKEILEAKPVVIKTEINYDIAPPANLGEHSVDFVGRNIRQTVYHNGSIKPGRYTYKVAKSGYQMMGNEKVIEILPSENPYHIQENMIAQSRRISLQINKDGKLVDAEEVYMDGEKVTFDKTFVPGKQYRFVAKFRHYQTVEKIIAIPPGSGVYVLDLPLIHK